jgi:hypothetical protein
MDMVRIRNTVLLNEQKHKNQSKLISSEYTSINSYELAKSLAKSEGLTLIWKSFVYETTNPKSWPLNSTVILT